MMGDRDVAPDNSKVLEMLNNSFINIPLMQDQDIIDIKCPVPIEEPASQS